MIDKAPTITKISGVGRTSFSDYIRWKSATCSLKSWPSSGIAVSPHLPQPNIGRSVIVGFFFHELLAEICGIHGIAYDEGIRSIRDLYKYKIEDFKVRFSPSLQELSPAFDYWPEMSSVLKTVQSIYERDSELESSPEREVPIEDTINHLFGILDEVESTSNGITVREYKTTRDIENLTQDKYIEQLHFYSILIRSKFGEYPDKLILEGLMGVTSEIQIDPSRIDTIIENIKHLEYLDLSNFDRKYSTKQVASPNEIDCAQCRFNIACPSLLRDKQPWSLGNKKEIAIVQVQEKLAEKGAIRVSVIGGTIPESDSSAIELIRSNVEIELLNIGQYFLISGLQTKGSTYQATTDSQVFVYESEM